MEVSAPLCFMQRGQVRADMALALSLMLCVMGEILTGTWLPFGLLIPVSDVHGASQCGGICLCTAVIHIPD